MVHGDHDVEIGDNVVIGHNVMCHAKTVENRVVIGNGAAVSDGVVIGEYSISQHWPHRSSTPSVGSFVHVFYNSG